jgi:uncharacterized protein (DUF1697 family)
VARYAAFLRGVNLGAKRKASSSDLRATFEGLGFKDVATFRTSGNVAFEAPRASEKELVAAIEKGLAKSLGFDVTVFLRSAAQIDAIVERKPFKPAELRSSKGKLQVALLARKPSAQARKKALAAATDDDKIAVSDRELYWLPSGGTKDSALGQTAIDELIGPATMRTKGTIEQLAAKYFG